MEGFLYGTSAFSGGAGVGGRGGQLPVPCAPEASMRAEWPSPRHTTVDRMRSGLSMDRVFFSRLSQASNKRNQTKIRSGYLDDDRFHDRLFVASATAVNVTSCSLSALKLGRLYELFFYRHLLFGAPSRELSMPGIILEASFQAHFLFDFLKHLFVQPLSATNPRGFSPPHSATSTAPAPVHLAHTPTRYIALTLLPTPGVHYI